MPPALLSGLALVVAVAAGGLATWALTRPVPAPQPCDCKAQLPAVALPSTYQTYQAELAQLRERVGQLEDQRRTEPPAAPASVAPASVAAPGSVAAVAPRFVRFVTPSPALRVEEAPNGSIAVFNTDPKLTGQVVLVQAERADGTATTLPITVPAP